MILGKNLLAEEVSKKLIGMLFTELNRLTENLKKNSVVMQKNDAAKSCYRIL
jgi:hypothetical protein